MEDVYSSEKQKIMLPLALFLITTATTVTAGAFYEGVDPFKNPSGLVKGIPFSVSLLFILGAHELGHYFTSRKNKVRSTLPFFIPAPPIPPLIGTFGAVIKMKSPITKKKSLVDIGASGPLIGFLASIIVVFIGLKFSTVIPKPTEGIGLGSSIVFKFLSYLAKGHLAQGYDINLHSVAFAGWIGFFVTSLNLLPIGQLDGGHIVYALMPNIHRVISIVTVLGLFVFGLFTWHGWIVWGALVSIIGIRHPPTEDEDTPLDWKRIIVSIITLIVFVLTFTPEPFYIF